MEVRSVSVAGLGKLGACMAACFASRGIDVIGVDISPATVDAINAGRAPVVEPDLDELISQNRSRLIATTDYVEAVKRSDATFIVVPTPSMEDGAFSLRYVVPAAREIGRALGEKDGYHIIVVTSTVLPGATESSVLPALEEASGKRCGPDFGLCYNPEFIALGTVIRDFLNPDFVLIGQSSEKVGSALEACYREGLGIKAPVARMSFANAELAKLAVNTFVTTKITFANMLAELCERLPGGDVDVVTSALGLDSRIGRKYLTGALGYGGPCFPRDNVALAQFARSLGASAMLAEATNAENNRLSERVLREISARLPFGARIAVLGLAYKPATPVVEASSGLALLRRLAAAGYDVVGFDPVALETARRELCEQVAVAGSLAEALRGVDAFVVANPDPAFAEATQLLDQTRPVLIVDCWRLLRSQMDGQTHVTYLPMGVGPSRAATTVAEPGPNR